MLSLPLFKNKKTLLQKRLLAWYEKEKRPLPWRRTRDPYKIWISEIMLQQTQVSTVIPYYKKWLAVFPTVRSLAKAPLARALKLWEGLGYYRRAKMLHRTAKIIVKNFRGKIPATAEALRKLPGIGRYSAGAIASIAFEEKTPVLDGNVIRLMTRLFTIRQSVDSLSTVKTLWQIVDSLLPDRSIGDFNQALMELGATVCFPQNPECSACPLSKLCKARCRGKEIDFPVGTKKQKYQDLRMYALVLENDKKKAFLQKQPAGHWWAGLWTFPFWNIRAQLLRSAGGKKGVLPLGTIRHSVTRYRITLQVFRKFLREGDPLPLLKGCWFGRRELTNMALPAPHRKISRILIHAG